LAEAAFGANDEGLGSIEEMERGFVNNTA